MKSHCVGEKTTGQGRRTDSNYIVPEQSGTVQFGQWFNSHKNLAENLLYTLVKTILCIGGKKTVPLASVFGNAIV